MRARLLPLCSGGARRRRLRGRGWRGRRIAVASVGALSCHLRAERVRELSKPVGDAAVRPLPQGTRSSRARGCVAGGRRT